MALSSLTALPCHVIEVRAGWSLRTGKRQWRAHLWHVHGAMTFLVDGTAIGDARCVGGPVRHVVRPFTSTSSPSSRRIRHLLGLPTTHHRQQQQSRAVGIPQTCRFWQASCRSGPGRTSSGSLLRRHRKTINLSVSSVMVGTAHLADVSWTWSRVGGCGTGVSREVAGQGHDLRPCAGARIGRGVEGSGSQPTRIQPKPTRHRQEACPTDMNLASLQERSWGVVRAPWKCFQRRRPPWPR